MEENKNSQEENVPAKPITPTFMKDDPKGLGYRNSTGKTLRREYIYKQRDKYIIDNQKVPTPEQMEVFAQEARMKYPQDGDYRVVGDQAEWMGEY